MRGARGFTLLEVLIAVTVVTLLLFTVYGVFSSASAAKERLEGEGEGYHRARVLFDRLGREIRGAYLNPRSPGTRFLGGLDEEHRPFLEFSTTASSPLSGGGISVVRYRLREGDLVRSESPLPGEEGGRDYRLAAGVGALRLRFYDGSWHEEWGEGLPQLVEVELVLDAGGEVAFRSAFEIPALEVE